MTYSRNKSLIGFALLLSSFSAVHLIAQERPAVTSQSMRSFINDWSGTFPPDISSDGKWVAYCAGDTNSRLWILDLERGTSRNLRPDAKFSRAPVWSPDGKSLAFYSDAGNSAHLFVWNRETDKIIEFPDAEVSGPPGPFHYQLRFARPVWSVDGKYVFYAALPLAHNRAPQASGVSRTAVEKAGDNFEILESEKAIAVRAARDGRSQPSSETIHSPLGDVGTVCDLVMADVDGGKTFRLLTGAVIMSILPSPDGKTLAVRHETNNAAINVRQSLYNLYVLPIPSLTELPDKNTARLSEKEIIREGALDWRGSKPIPLIKDVYLFAGSELSWSPDSRWIAYASQGELATGDVFTVDVKNGTVRNLTERFQLPSNPRDDSRRNFAFRGKFGQSYEPPLWTADGASLLCLRDEQYDDARGIFRRDLWMVPANGGTPRNLTAGSPLRILSIVRARASFVAPVSPDAESVVVKVEYLGENKSGFGTANLRTGEFAPLVKESKSYFPIFIFSDAASAPGLIVYEAESSTAPADLWLVDVRSKSTIPRQLTHLNPQWEGRDFGSVKKLEWKTKSGTTLNGVLLLPPTTSTSRKVPLVAWVYGGHFPSKAINSFAFGWTETGFEPGVLIAHGYAVLLPDIPIAATGNACDQISDDVLPALDAAVATGYVDGQRLGVIGHSFGGYSTNCLITRTSRFKAAVSLSGLSDMVSLTLSKSAFGTGQAKLGATLWENRERYIENSPVFHLDKVTTPLLLAHGEKDDNAPPQQSDEMYRGLRALNKEVVLLKVKNGEHDVFAQPGVWEQIFRWFDAHLRN